MKVIKVGDLADKYKEQTEGYIELDVFTIGGRPLMVKKYIPYFDKINILTSVYMATAEIENMLGLRKAVLTVELVRNYTNVNLPKDTALAYDYVVATGIYEGFMSALSNVERNEILEIIDILDEQEKIERDYKLSFQEALQSVIPTVADTMQLVKDTEDVVNTMNPENLDFVKDFMKKASV